MGSPGGSTIIGAVLNVLLNRMDHGRRLDDATKDPRVIARNRAAFVEEELLARKDIIAGLTARGAHLESYQVWIGHPAHAHNFVQSIELMANGTVMAVADPRDSLSGASVL